MSDENSGFDTSQLDLSIVSVDLGSDAVSHHRPRRGFWRAAWFDPEMALVPRKLITEVHVEHPLSPNYTEIVDKIADLHKVELKSAAEPENIERPVEVDDQVAECTPQFILRNIPKVERYYDLDRPLSFNLDDMPFTEAKDMIEEAHHTHLGKIEFIPVESVDFLNDFRNFLEEIFVLCPWEQATRKEPDETSPWHIKNSTSKLALDLLSRKNTLFIFSEKGMTSMGMKDYKPREENNDFQENRPHIGFGPG